MTCPNFNISQCDSLPNIIATNSGIGGIGVYWSFIGAAIFAGALILSLLVFDCIIIDREHWEHGSAQCGRCKIRETLESTLLGLSDTQLVASLAQLIARETQQCKIAVYYYNLVSDYVLVASLTHAATLLMLSRKFRTMPVRIVIRAILLLAISFFAAITASLGLDMATGHKPAIAYPAACYLSNRTSSPTTNENTTTMAFIVITIVVFASSNIGIFSKPRTWLDSTSVGYIARLIFQVAIPLTAWGFGMYVLINGRNAVVYTPDFSNSINLSDDTQSEWGFGQVLAMINLGFALLFTLNNYPASERRVQKIRKRAMPPNALFRFQEQLIKDAQSLETLYIPLPGTNEQRRRAERNYQYPPRY